MSATSVEPVDVAIKDDQLDEFIERVMHLISTHDASENAAASHQPSQQRQQQPILDFKFTMSLIQQAQQIFLSEPLILDNLKAPIKIVGNIQAQLPDLIRMFTRCGFPSPLPKDQYLFLGSYANRGNHYKTRSYNIETLCLLLAFKIKFRQNFFMLRGQAEMPNIARIYGFYDDLKNRVFQHESKENKKILWKAFSSLFNSLPFAAVVSNTLFCVHSGLSPYFTEHKEPMTELKRLFGETKRPCDVPDDGFLTDMLWSDPEVDAAGWIEPGGRGVSYDFGIDIVEIFLKKTDLKLIVRSHQVVEDGFEYFTGDNKKLVTIFSAPNYCGDFDNTGAIMSVDEEVKWTFQILKAPVVKKSE